MLVDLLPGCGPCSDPVRYTVLDNGRWRYDCYLLDYVLNPYLSNYKIPIMCTRSISARTTTALTPSSAQPNRQQHHHHHMINIAVKTADIYNRESTTSQKFILYLRVAWAGSVLRSTTTRRASTRTIEFRHVIIDDSLMCVLFFSLVDVAALRRRTRRRFFC